MELRFSLRTLFGYVTILCGLLGGILAPAPHGVFVLLAVAIAMVVLWPWLFRKG